MNLLYRILLEQHFKNIFICIRKIFRFKFPSKFVSLGVIFYSILYSMKVIHLLIQLISFFFGTTTTFTEVTGRNIYLVVIISTFFIQFMLCSEHVRFLLQTIYVITGSNDHNMLRFSCGGLDHIDSHRADGIFSIPKNRNDSGYLKKQND
jgi:hypothetical protein